MKISAFKFNYFDKIGCLSKSYFLNNSSWKIAGEHQMASNMKKRQYQNAQKHSWNCCAYLLRNITA